MALDDCWTEDAIEAIEELAYTSPTFTADDLRAKMRPAPNPKMVGGAFTAAVSAGIITRAGYTESRAKSRRRGVIRVWTIARAAA
jgi:hypothetical protein